MAVPPPPPAFGLTHCFRLYTRDQPWPAMPEASRFWDLVLDFSDVSIHPRIPGKYGIQLWLIGAHFHWKLSSKKTLLHKPDSYGEQSSLRVNTSYTEDHESSAIDAGLLLWPITGKRSNEPWNWFVKTSIPVALSPVLENVCRSFSRPNWPPLGEDGIYPDFLNVTSK